LSEREWRKELAELAQALEGRFQNLEKSLKEIGERSSSPSPASSQEGSEMPLYKCKNGKCTFATDDLDAYIEHKIDHKTSEKPTEEASPARPARHETVEDYLNCPECFPRFEKAFLARGYLKKEPEPKKKPAKNGGRLAI